MLLREKLQVLLGVVGLGLVGMGLSFALTRQPQPLGAARPAYGAGFWKDHRLAPEARRTYGPWLIGLGAAALGAAVIVRPR